MSRAQPATDDFALRLRELGVGESTLSAAERERLDRDGFVALERALAPWLVNALLEHLDRVRLGGAPDKAMHDGEPGCWRADRVLGLHRDFHACWASPRLLAAVQHLLGEPFMPVALNYRASLTGHGWQAMHHDAPWLGRPPTRGYAQSIVALVPFTAHNGATRVVPGSHRWDRLPNEAMRDPEAPHPKEVALEGPAGTIFVLDGNCWHAGGRNETAIPRHALYLGWMARSVDHPALRSQRETVPERMLREIAPAAAAVLAPPPALRAAAAFA